MHSWRCLRRMIPSVRFILRAPRATQALIHINASPVQSDGYPMTSLITSERGRLLAWRPNRTLSGDVFLAARVIAGHPDGIVGYVDGALTVGHLGPRLDALLCSPDGRKVFIADGMNYCIRTFDVA